jgi:ornithine carbamoyltransferase
VPVRAAVDCLTLRDRFGELDGLQVAYVGDGQAVANSLVEAAMLSGIELRLAAPLPDPALVGRAGQAVRICESPDEATAGADAVLDATSTREQVANLLPVQQAVLRTLVTGDWEV